MTTAGALAQLNAEAVAGMAFAQLVHPGTPVVYGNTIATVSMQSGAPTYGTAETVILGLAVTQLARRYGVPSRTAGMRTGSKTCDADAGAQSMIAILSALLGRVHFVLHAAGFLESGLSASFAKMVIDADQLSHLLGIVKGLDVDDDTLALDAIRDIGPSGHFFGHGHTIEHYDSAFYRPMTAETGTWDQWVEEGRRDVEARAAAVAASLIDSFEPPPLDEAVAERHDGSREALLDWHDSLGAGACKPFAHALRKRPVPFFAACTHGTMYRAEERTDFGVFVATQQVAPRPVFEGTLRGVVLHQASRSARRFAPSMEAANEPQGHLEVVHAFALTVAGAVFPDAAECVFGHFECLRGIDRCRRCCGESVEATLKPGRRHRASLRERLRLQVRKRDLRPSQPLAALISRQRPKDTPRRRRPFAAARRLDACPSKQGFEPCRGLYEPRGQSVASAIGKTKVVVEHMRPGGIRVQHARRRAGPVWAGTEQCIGHPRLHGQPRVHARHAVGVAYQLPSFGVEQPVPRQSGPDVEAEIRVDKRREHDQPIVFGERGEAFAQCQGGWAPVNWERIAVDGNRVTTLPTCRMQPHDSRVGPAFAEPLHLPRQVLRCHDCCVRSLSSE